MEILVFSHTAGYRHESIEAGVAACAALGRRMGVRVVATEDPQTFTASSLERFAAVVFLNTSGDVFDERQCADFAAYIRRGGGFVGVHAAATTQTGSPFFTGLVGAVFARHPQIQRGRVTVADPDHPATEHLDSVWMRTDEWYDFVALPPPRVRVLLRVDESSYLGATMGPDHPLAWCQLYEGGRSFYTAMGHTVDSYDEDAFLNHLWGGVAWAAAQ